MDSTLILLFTLFGVKNNEVKYKIFLKNLPGTEIMNEVYISITDEKSFWAPSVFWALFSCFVLPITKIVLFAYLFSVHLSLLVPQIECKLLMDFALSTEVFQGLEHNNCSINIGRMSKCYLSWKLSERGCYTKLLKFREA